MSSVLAAVLGGLVVVGVAVLDGGPEAILAGAVLGAASGQRTAWCARAAATSVASRVRAPPDAQLRHPAGADGAVGLGAHLCDRLLLEHLGRSPRSGTYAMANRLASVLLLVVTAFAIAFSPFALELRTRDPEHERPARTGAHGAGDGARGGRSRASVFAREATEACWRLHSRRRQTPSACCALGRCFFGIASVRDARDQHRAQDHIFAAYSASAPS